MTILVYALLALGTFKLGQMIPNTLDKVLTIYRTIRLYFISDPVERAAYLHSIFSTKLRWAKFKYQVTFAIPLIGRSLAAYKYDAIIADLTSKANAAELVMNGLKGGLSLEQMLASAGLTGAQPTSALFPENATIH